MSFAQLGSFQLGGEAGLVLKVQDSAGLVNVRRILADHDVPVVLIGEGSNVLFSDEGWAGIVVRYADAGQKPVALGDGLWRVSAAMRLDHLCEWATESGWSGLEAFTGIPGTVGGAVVGNAGAWGVQMADVVTMVEVITPEGERRRLLPADCAFSYRDSALKASMDWVSEVELTLTPADMEVLAAERRRILAERASRHPDWHRTPCIGSFFRNLEPSSQAERRRAAGYFLETAGAKALRVGGAAVYEGHANIPIKQDVSCRAADVVELARQMQNKVREVHGIELVREVRYLGNMPGESSAPGFH